jgi:hypothetical protein
MPRWLLLEDENTRSCHFEERGDTMFYVKNIPGWERAMRMAAGVAMAGYGLWAMDGWASYAVAAMGAMMAGTGMMGFCPMCAMVGRKLGEK